jgi:tRNA (mo5U34)-methyltransferase
LPDPALADRAAALDWYHSIDLGDGLVTEGWFDLRPAVARVPLPASLAGKRCLDVGTWDGFWAFEMERRGAAEVVAVDILDPQRWDWPPRERRTGHGGGLAMLEAIKGRGEAFGLACEALGSRVERLDLSVYDLDPVELGHFDVVFLGSLLLHLRDPVRALERLRSVCAGEAIIADTVELGASRRWPRTPIVRLEGLERPWWWQPNRAALLQMIQSAGFTIREAGGIYYVPQGAGHPKAPWRSLPRRALSAQGREEIVVATRGIPHVAVRATP